MKRASILLVIPLLSYISARAQDIQPGAIGELTALAYQYYLSNPDTAIVITEAALKKALQSKDVFHEGYCYFLFSKAYWVKANYKLGTEYGFKALKIFRSTTHYKELSATLLSLARTLVELGNLQKAKNFIHEAMELGREHSDERIQAAAHREHSYLLAEQNKLDSALQVADKGLELFKKLRDSLEVSVLYGRKSRLYFAMKKYTESKRYAYAALMIDSLVGNRRGLGISYYQVAQNEFALGNRQTAIRQLKQSIRISNGIGNLTSQIKAHDLLADFYLKTNQPALAASELQQVSVFKDELYNSEKNGQIQEMQSLHDVDIKENTIRLLEHENDLRDQQMKNQRLFVAFLLVAVLFLVLLSFVLTRLRSIQKKANRNLANQNTAIEQQKMAIQIQAENLQQIDQVKTKLFSVISHDLRGPISNLQSLLDLFTKKLMTAEEFVNLSAKLRENLNLTQRTLENLLNWSLSQMGGIKTEKRKIELTQCIEETCNLMDEVAARKNVSLVRQFNGPLKVWADADQLQVVLRNLIHNAIKFSSFNDSIAISASRDGELCHIAVKDSGIGMTYQEIETIVGAKEYFSKIGTEQEKGTGLGLLLCKEFITRNGGKINIRSSVGGGTEVSFSLRLAEHENTPQYAVQ